MLDQYEIRSTAYCILRTGTLNPYTEAPTNHLHPYTYTPTEHCTHHNPRTHTHTLRYIFKISIPPTISQSVKILKLSVEAIRPTKRYIQPINTYILHVEPDKVPTPLDHVKRHYYTKMLRENAPFFLRTLPRACLRSPPLHSPAFLLQPHIFY